MMMSIVNSQSFQFLQAKGNSWDAGKLKKTATERFEALDTNHDGQIDRNEAIASGGLFGKNNFVIDNQSSNATDAWAAVAGKNQRMSLREFTALGLYIDGTKSATNKNNEMDGIITARESVDVMNELSKTKNNPYVAPKLYNTIDLNAQNFGLDKFIARESEQVDSVKGEETLSKIDNIETQRLLEEANTALKKSDELKASPDKKKSNNGFDWGSLLSSLIPSVLPMIMGLFQGKPSQPEQPPVINNPYAGLPQQPASPLINNPYVGLPQQPASPLINNPYVGLPQQPASPLINNPYAGGLPQPQQMAMTPPPSFVRGGF
jgi:Ca2+-binding EF-hand superfamily protein